MTRAARARRDAPGAATPVRRARLAAWAALAACAACAAPLPRAGMAGAEPAAPSIRCEPATLVADDELAWQVSLTVTNPLAAPLTADSGRVTVEDLSPNETNDTRTSELPLSRLVASLGTLAPGESRTLRWTAPAMVEQGRVAFEIDAHDSLGTPHHLRVAADAQPGEFSKSHPSTFLDVDGRRVEVVYVAPADTSAPAPGVLLVHGHAHYARQMLRGARALSRAGFAVMILSQPGYGRSAGPPDYMGPHTLAAASAALDRLARTPGVDSTRLGAWGVSRGATVVALLMTKRGDLDAVVAQAGIYDLWAEYRGTRFDGIRAKILAEAGRDSAAWRERSAAYSIDALKGRLLILHGENDENVPVGQAKAFFAALEARGAAVEAVFTPAAAHALPREQTSQRATEFLRRGLGMAEPAR